MRIILPLAFMLFLFLSLNVGEAQLIWYDHFTRDVFDPWITYLTGMSISAIDGYVTYFSYHAYPPVGDGGMYRYIPIELTDFSYSFQLNYFSGTGHIHVKFNDTLNKELEIEIFPNGYTNTIMRIYYDGVLYNSSVGSPLCCAFWVNFTISRNGNFVSVYSPPVGMVSYNLPTQYPVSSVNHYFKPIAGYYVMYFIDNSILSTPLEPCFNITSPGTYTLTADIVSNARPGYPCIRINSSNVILDMNNYTIWGCGGRDVYGSCTSWGSFGIAVYPDVPPELRNITVKNGRIVGFGGSNIFLGTIKNSSVQNINTTTGDVGVWATGVWNLTIKDSDIRGAGKGLHLGGVVYSNFRRLKLDNMDYGIYGSGVDYSNFSMINIYTHMINTTVIPECFYGGWGTTCIYPALTNATYHVVRSPGVGIYLSSSVNTTIEGSLFGTEDDGVVLNGKSYKNIIGNSLSYNPPGQYKGFRLTATTHDNLLCNLVGHIINYGTNNVYDNVCPPWLAPPPLFPCIPGYTCDIYQRKLLYVDPFCNILNQTDCPYGCDPVAKVCRTAPVALPPPIPINTTPMVTIPGYEWAGVFLSPWFFVNLIIFAIAGAIGIKMKSPLAFVIALFFLVLAFTLAGVYPLWLMFIFIIIAGGIIAYVVMKMVRGE